MKIFNLILLLFVVNFVKAQDIYYNKNVVNKYIESVDSDTTLKKVEIKDTLFEKKYHFYTLKMYYRNDVLVKVRFIHGVNKASKVYETYYLKDGNILEYSIRDIKSYFLFENLKTPKFYMDLKEVKRTNDEYKHLMKCLIEDVIFYKKLIKNEKS